jgi:hypothetical protein
MQYTFLLENNPQNDVIPCQKVVVREQVGYLLFRLAAVPEMFHLWTRSPGFRPDLHGCGQKVE